MVGLEILCKRLKHTRVRCYLLTNCVISFHGCFTSGGLGLPFWYELQHDSLDKELDSSIHHYHIAFRSYDPNQRRLTNVYNEHIGDSVSSILVLLQYPESRAWSVIVRYQILGFSSN